MKIYTVIIALAICIFLIGNVSSADFDNVKSYDSNTRTVTVTNLFGIGSDIATIQLKTPLHVVVAPGYQKVAEFRVRAFTNYAEALKSISFYDKANKNTNLNSVAYDFKYKSVQVVEVPDYSKTCETKIYDKNQTKYEVCSTVQTGSHEEKKEVWLPMSKDVLNNQDLEIGIFTNVKPGDYVEWIPKFFGVTIDEWASWSASLNVNLNAYYKFDEAVGTGGTVIDTYSVNNGTNIGAVNITGKIVYAYDYEATDTTDRIWVPDSSNFTHLGAYAISFWAKPESLHSGYVIRHSGGNGFYIAFVTGTNTIQFLSGSTNLVSDVTYSAGTWYNVVAQRLTNGTMQLFVNNVTQTSQPTDGSGTIDPSENLTIGNDNGGVTPFDGIIDEMAIWNRSLTRAEIEDLYNNGNGITWEAPTPDNPPTVTPQAPANNSLYLTAPQDINFTCYGSDDINFTMMEFYLNESLTGVNSSGLNNTNYTFEQTNLNDGNYNWSCIGYDNNSQSTSTGNLFFTIDSNAPIITVNSPNSSYDLLLNHQNLTLNISIEDASNLDTIYYIYNGTQTDITHGSSSTWEINDTITYEGGSNNITIFANDTLGNANTYVFNWTVKVVDYGGFYHNETTEGALEYFNNTVRLGSGLSITDLDLVYNGTLEGGSTTTSGDYEILEKDNLEIPQIENTTNVSFYWSLQLSDSSIINLTSYNQTIYNLSLDDCSTFTNELYNFTILDEETQANLSDTTLEIAVNIYDATRSNIILNLSASYPTNPTRICLNRNLTSGNLYLIDAIIRYEALTNANEYYNIVNSSLTSTTTSQIIKLYDLNLSDSTEFQVTFTGSDYQPVEDALIYLFRQYISENTFKTVELPLTDSNGQTILHMVRNNVIYNIQVIKNGVVLGTFNNLNAFCEDFTIGDCKINLNSADSNTDLFSYTDLGISFNPPYFNATTSRMIFDFVSLDGTSKTIFMNVTRDNVFGNNSVCNSTLTSSGGSLTCTIPGSVDESLLRTKIYVNGNLILVQNIETGNSNLGPAGYLALFVMAISFILIFSDSKNGVLFGILLSFIGGISFGMITGSLLGLGVSGIWVIVIVVIGLYKLNKDRPQ